MVNSALENISDRSFYIFNFLVSSAALAFLAYILVLRDGDPTGADLSFLPTVNATLNAISAALLGAGWLAIRRRKLRLHKRLVVAAFAASALFLVSYLVYHWSAGDTPYEGEGLLRSVYFFVLISHIVLSIFVVPGALAAFFFAFKRQFAKHKKVTRILMPIWLYVSVTGVVVYFMLRGSVAV